MKVITVCNKKGGVGKTTIAVHLASMFARKGKTLLIDADEQGTSMKYREKRLEHEKLSQFSAVQILSKSLCNDVKTMTADYIIIDVGAGDGKVLRSALMCSNLVIVPFKATVFDIESTQEALDIIDEIRIGVNFQLYGLFNMLKSGVRAHKMIEDLKEGLKEDYSMNFFDTIIGSRVSFEYATGQGYAIDEIDPKERDLKAIEEMSLIYEKLCEVLNG